MPTPNPATRFGSAFLAQILPSVSSFVVSLYAARTLGIFQFGQFGIAFSMSVLAVGVVRALTSEGAMFVAGKDPEARKKAVTAAYSAVLSASLMICVVGILIYFVDAVPSSLALVVLSTGVLVLQDVSRNLLIAHGREPTAFVTEALVLTTAITVLFTSGPTTYGGIFLTWAISALVPTAVNLSVLRIRPTWIGTASWYRNNRGMTLSLCGDYLLSNGLSQGSTLVVAAFAGLPGSAAMRGMQMVSAPVLVFSRALMMTLVSKRLLLKDRFSFARTSSSLASSYTFSLVILVAVLLCGVLTAPEHLLEKLFGESHEAVRSLMPWGLGAIAASLFATGGGFKLRLDGLFAKATLIRAKVFPISILFLVAGTAAWGAAGSQAGLASSELIRGALNWHSPKEKNDSQS